MSPFDPVARANARNRAMRIASPFLLDSAFDETVERLAAIARPRKQLLLAGSLSPRWAASLPGEVHSVPLDPESMAALEPGRYDAVIALGGLDTLDRPQEALFMLGAALKADRPLIGAVLGGASLPRLRSAAMAADQARYGGAHARMHPRLDGPTLAAMLQQAGLVMPVVDVERSAIRYLSLNRLITDLRAVAATNQLAQRPRTNPGKAWRGQLEDAFLADPVERVEWLHFLGWSRP